LPNQKFTLNNDSIRLEKIGQVKLVLDRAVPMGCQFILVKTEIIQKPKTGKSIGLDIGIKTFLTGNNGFTIENPKYFRENQTKLKAEQQHLSRKKQGSWRYNQAKLKVARIHNNIANKRKDFIQKTTTKLVDEYDFIAIEDLNVSGMVKNHPLAKSISDASFAEFYSTLSYKAAWYGKEVVKIDRWFASSKTCSGCGWKDENLTLSERTFKCQACGLELNRDLNASENILKEALRVSSAIRTPSKCQTEIA
jgi:putative transposase